MATKAIIIATPSKETPISQCQANHGFNFSPSTDDLMMKVQLETTSSSILICYFYYSPFLPKPFLTFSVGWC